LGNGFSFFSNIHEIGWQDCLQNDLAPITFVSNGRKTFTQSTSPISQKEKYFFLQTFCY